VPANGVRLSTAPQRLRISYGYLKALPGDYIGARHVVTVKQLPPGLGGEDWFEWEERPGPGRLRMPTASATSRSPECATWREKRRPEIRALAGRTATDINNVLLTNSVVASDTLEVRR